MKRVNVMTLSKEARKRVREMVLTGGVAATSKTLKVGREHVLMAAGDLPLLPTAVAAFLEQQLVGELLRA